MPGLIDNHVHPLGVANSWANLRLKNPSDRDAILAEVKAYAEANPDLPMIRGEAWNLGVFENNSPRKELLDAIDPERPIYLQSQTGHSAWANSKALQLAGITKETPNGGPFVFDVDEKSGEPSGTVREFAMGAVEQALPSTDPQRYGPALARVISEFNENGFTSLKCAEGTRDWTSGAAALDREGGLNARLSAAWEWRSHYTPHTKEEQDALPYEWKKYATDRVFPRHVKMFPTALPTVIQRSSSMIMKDARASRRNRIFQRRSSSKRLRSSIPKVLVSWSMCSVTVGRTRSSISLHRCENAMAKTVCLCTSRMLGWRVVRISNALPRFQARSSIFLRPCVIRPQRSPEA